MTFWGPPGTPLPCSLSTASWECSILCATTALYHFAVFPAFPYVISGAGYGIAEREGRGEALRIMERLLKFSSPT